MGAFFGRHRAGLGIDRWRLHGDIAEAGNNQERAYDRHHLGDWGCLVYRNVPFFRWGQEEYRRDVKAWAIDAYVTQELSRAVQPRYTVIPVEYDRAPFLDKDLYWKVSTAGALPDAGPIGNTVHDHVRGPKVDFYVLVLAGSAPVGMTVTSAGGMGVLRYPDFGDDRYYVHTVYRIAVVDGHSFEPLAILNAVNKEKYPMDGLINGAPYEEFEAQHWGGERADYGRAG